jgi:hypothetical protein
MKRVLVYIQQGWFRLLCSLTVQTHSSTNSYLSRNNVNILQKVSHVPISWLKLTHCSFKRMLKGHELALS